MSIISPHRLMADLLQIFIGTILLVPAMLSFADETEALAKLAELKRLSEEKKAAMATTKEPERGDMIRQEAFDGFVEEELYPLNEEQIKALKKSYQDTFKAIAGPVSTPPKPLVSSQFVSLAPGSTPPVIRVATGFVSSLVFLDSTGAPWPISSYVLGNTAALQVQWNGKNHVLVVQAKKWYVHANMVVSLQGLDTPIAITFVPEQKVIDCRVDLRVQGYGPQAQTLPAGDEVPSAESEALLGVLEGVPPSGADRMQVDDAATSAWTVGSVMFVRTKYKLLSPGWISSLRSVDGTRAYQMMPTPHLLVSSHGRIKTIKIAKMSG